MTIDGEKLRIIQSWCGRTVGTMDDDTHDTGDIAARLERLSSAEAVAIEVLRQRRADMLRDPLNFSVEGDFSQDAAENIRRLDADIAALERIVGVAGSRRVTVSHFTREDLVR